MIYPEPVSPDAEMVNAFLKRFPTSLPGGKELEELLSYSPGFICSI